MDFLRVVADKFSLIQAFEPSFFFQMTDLSAQTIQSNKNGLYKTIYRSKSRTEPTIAQ